MNRSRFVFRYFLVVTLFVSFHGCQIEPLKNENITAISYTKAEIDLNYSVINGQKNSDVYVSLFNMKYDDFFHTWSQGAKIDSVKNGTLTINGVNMVYGLKNGKRCFYPETNVNLKTDSIYHIILTVDSIPYDFNIRMPYTFDDLQIDETINPTEGLRFQLNNTSGLNNTSAYISIANPGNYDEKYILADGVISYQDVFRFPISIIPFIDGWKGEVNLEKSASGHTSKHMNPLSYIRATCIFKDGFVVKK